MGYAPAAELQARVLDAVLEGRLPDTLLFVEHPAVLTLGANFHQENLLFTPEQYAGMGIEVHRTDRGGDVTFHGPRQLVIYPIFNLERHGKDLHRWLRDLEETMIRTLAGYGLEGYRFPPNTGVWVNHRKVAAIGIKVRRWVSMHGIALNCNNDLGPFELIVPCGIKDHGVTSLIRALGREVTIQEAMPRVESAFAEVFGLELRRAERSVLDAI